MVAEQRQIMLTHVIDFSDQFKVVTNAYNNKFTRNWYKLDDVVFEGDKQSLSRVLANPSAFPNHMSLLN